jgi:hypothetical protein
MMFPKSMPRSWRCSTNLGEAMSSLDAKAGYVTAEVGYVTTEGDVQIWEVMWHNQKLERHISVLVRLPKIEGESAGDAGSRAIELAREMARQLMSIEPKLKSWLDDDKMSGGR